MKDLYKHTIVITNKNLVKGDYLTQIKKVVALKPCAVILREKELGSDSYKALATSVNDICLSFDVPLFIHTHVDIARQLNIRRIHLSIPSLLSTDSDLLSTSFDEVSVSCHSYEDVLTALSHGATQIILGTIFETDCKPGLTGKGLSFVRDICSISPVPVYAIGGIKPHNLASVIDAGATGGCMMSEFMRM